MSETKKLIQQNKALLGLVAKTAKDRMGKDPWDAYEWGKRIIDSVAEGNFEIYCYGIKKLVEVMEI